MNRMTLCLLSAACLSVAPTAHGAWDADAGVDLRIRQEIMENVPGLPGGGFLSTARRGGYVNHMRFRPRIWGELTASSEDVGTFRLYLRLTDEMRWYVHPWKNANTWPDELIVDNLFLEGKGLFGGLVDFTVGRQDIYGLYGLDHVFVDGSPDDGSRTVYADMARLRFNLNEERKIDLFGIYNADDNILRWGTDRGKHRAICGLDPSAARDADDWGYGIIWSDRAAPGLPYQVFILQKTTREWTDKNGTEHPWAQRETLGTKWVPELNDEWSAQLEAMGQVGCNGNGETLTGWSAYAGLNWKSSRSGTVRPFGKLGYHFMSGDDDAANETGGNDAWDPIWARGVNDSELFLYGTHYGGGWWSNMHYVKLTAGIDLGAHHRVTGSCGPLFAAAQDGLGGGDGLFKGFLSQVRYDMPFWIADKTKGERFEVFGHVLAEFFNPGDYFETEKPAFFVRWQVEFKF